MTRSNPTAEYLAECFDYNEETGYLYWKRRPKSHYAYYTGPGINAKLVGRRAGNVFQGKYRQVYIDGRTFYEHRVIYALCTGEWPPMVNHIDGNGLNNRFSNLIAGDYKSNGKNYSRYSNNKYGYTGIRPTTTGWSASITEDGRQVSLGVFPDKAAAIRARRAAERRLGYFSTHGQKSD
tara:strand:+ start:12113 stop:12649 length:537 start_codon:yes stop_codon:yes gene_type:complete